MNETPTILSCQSSSSLYDYTGTELDLAGPPRFQEMSAAQLGRMMQHIPDFPAKESKPMANTTTRRFVQVFIVDPCEDVSLADSVLVQGKPTLTDLTDQELFFEQPVAELLKVHNERRSKCLDKSATRKAGKDVWLEPIRIRDLKMLVVTLASF